MNKCEIIERLKNIAGYAVHTVGEEPFVMSLDDGIAVHEAIELLKKPETNCSEIPNSSDTISRQQSIDALRKMQTYKLGAGDDLLLIDQAEAQTELMMLPSTQPDVIRCKDCKWWDKYSDTRGYCLAAKHGYWSEHWDISIRRTYDADWYCADAERREGKQDE